MNSNASKVARFGMLTALALVLGWLDRAIPVTWFLSGAVPGIKLGLANTVLLYAVYLMDWKGCVLLMLAKVFLSGFMFGSMSAILYSLSGGALSLAVMLLVRHRPRLGALVIALLAAASDVMLLLRNPHPRGQLLWCMILIAMACLAAVAAFVIIGRRPEYGVLGTSLAGAVAHNIGQILAASAMLRTPQLLYTYLPVLVGIGAVVGCLTGIVAQRVFKALRIGNIQ
ncbi:MAG: Gx transporter family protein [Clostridia bacterium]|nr:Gx transporter family protein [Clostridia bacterium]